MKNIIAGMSMLALLSGCASIVSGSTQEIDIRTAPVAKVSCEAVNGRGTYTSNGQPGSMLVKRSQTRLEVSCDSAEYAGKLSHRAHVEPWFFGNLIIGGLVGLVVDPSTGAMFAYDSSLLVPLESKAGSASNGFTPSLSAPVSEDAADATQYEAPAAGDTATGNAASYNDLVKSGAIVEAPRQ